jgi:putative acetyltransferase
MMHSHDDAQPSRPGSLSANVASLASRTLSQTGHVDMLYVHPDFQRRGVARALLTHIERLARTQSLDRLYTEASITARPVFEAIGFRLIAPQTVIVRGECMTNYRMEKRLFASAGARNPT